jgi:hypothetical protein
MSRPGKRAGSSPARVRALPAGVKTTSSLRRVAIGDGLRYRALPALEGDVCAFELAGDAAPIVVEAVSGRAMTLAPRDIFLGTTGYRESTRWVVGAVPEGGLVPGEHYWVLTESGVAGNLIGDSPLAKGHLGRAKYLGVVQDGAGRTLDIRQCAARPDPHAADQAAPVFLVLGTSAEVGKTTAGVAVLRSLRQQGHRRVIALKATGTASVQELSTYRDFGAAQAFDCVDFGLPTTYPSGRSDIEATFERALDVCLSQPADAVLIECGGDMLGANVPVFLQSLKRRRSTMKIILVAADALGALGGKGMLEKMGLCPSLIAGPCTDTPTLRERTQSLCGVPAMNMARGEGGLA